MKKRILRVVERGVPDDGDAGDERCAAFAGEKVQWVCFNRNLVPPEQQAFTKDQKDSFEAQGYVCERLKKPKRV